MPYNHDDTIGAEGEFGESWADDFGDESDDDDDDGDVDQGPRCREVEDIPDDNDATPEHVGEFFGDDDESDIEDDDDDHNGFEFLVPECKNALHDATLGNPRCQPCPWCGEQNRLTPADVHAGYICDECVDRSVRGR